MGEDGREEYEEWKAANDQVRFYKVSGRDLDDEMREVTDQQDLLGFIRGGNQDF